MDDIECGGVTFLRNFDSANLAKVAQVLPPTPGGEKLSSSNASVKLFSDSSEVLEFNIWTTPDCAGTIYENGNRTWFYFGIRPNAPGLNVKLNIVDLNKQAKMYSQGMCPVFKVVPSKNGWERIRDKPTYSNEDEIFTLTFKYKTPENGQSVTYFAFTYPFSYSDIQKMLSNIDAKFLNAPSIENDDIYYVRECVCYSLENRRVDLLTISSKRGMSNVREARLRNLFPEPTLRPFQFPDKKVIFVSARVHPGETPSSFVFNGLLHLLLNREDSIAVTLRKLYVFKLIPCLNPDGVARGHYRTDARGVNLNRMYLNPSLLHHPSIYAARAIIRYHHFGAEKPDFITLCSKCIDNCPKDGTSTESESGTVMSKVSNMSLEENCDEEKDAPPISAASKCTLCGALLVEDNIKNDQGDISSEESRLFLYLDLHGHASKKGIFMYGNHFDTPEQNVECMLLAKLMSINNHNFHFTSCNFSERNMFVKDRRDGTSRAGSGRVAISSLTGLVKSYTLECNYNTGRIVNVLPPTVKERQQKGYALPVPPKYSPTVFEEVGRSLGASILDLTGNNPLTRIPHSEFHSLTGVMNWLRMNCVQDFDETGLQSSKNAATSKSKIKPSSQEMKIKPCRSTVQIDRKENVESSKSTTATSTSTSVISKNKIPRKKSTIRIHKTMLKKSKSKMTLSLKCKNNSPGGGGSTSLASDKIKIKKQPPVIVAGKKQSLFASWSEVENSPNPDKNACSSSLNSFSKTFKKHAVNRNRMISASGGAGGGVGDGKIEKVKKRKRLGAVKKL